jgi:hypothetical protein
MIIIVPILLITIGVSVLNYRLQTSLKSLQFEIAIKVRPFNYNHNHLKAIFYLLTISAHIARKMRDSLLKSY